jgi:hypothetical protein
MPLTKLDGPVIDIGQSVSAPLNCTAGRIIRIHAPAAWTPANITFQLSFDGTTWSELVDRSGNPVTTAVVPGGVIVLQPQMQQLAWLRIRSGTQAVRVNQAAQRVFQTILDTP